MIRKSEGSIVLGITRQICIPIILRPIIPQIPSRYLIIPSVILSPKGRLLTGIPMLLTDAMQESGEEKSTPIRSQFKTILISWFGIANNCHIARIFHSLISFRDHIVLASVPIFDF